MALSQNNRTTDRHIDISNPSHLTSCEIILKAINSTYTPLSSRKYLSLFKKAITCTIAAVAIYFLYFHAMDKRGLIGPDEPRYASVAREMIESDDWITPRLGAKAWFEKPVLLYWLGAVSAKLGVNDDRMTRLPVSLISIAFMFFFYRYTRRQFGPLEAQYALLILGTSIGWIAFSQIGTFDLPLSASLSAALLILMPWVQKSDVSTRKALPWFGALLGVSVLAKGLVGPAVGALTLLSVCRDRGFSSVIRDLIQLRVWLPFVAVAAPWYLFCYIENGNPFLEDFFWQHHFQRFTNDSLQHAQPFWFFIPVLALGFLPWTSFVVTRSIISFQNDARIRFLFMWCLSTLLLFSFSINKLPGYILPMFPPLAILAGLQLSRPRLRLGAFAIAGLSLMLVPIAEDVLPRALSHGLFAAWPPDTIAWSRVIGVSLATIMVLWAANSGKRTMAVQLLAAIAVVNISYLQIKTFPVIDGEAGVRPLWLSTEPHQSETCIGEVRRHVVYGLDYYSDHKLPRCIETPRPYHITGDPAQLTQPN